MGDGNHEVVEELVDYFVVFGTVEVDVSVGSDAEITVYATSIYKFNSYGGGGIDLELSPPRGGGDIARLMGLEMADMLDSRDRVDP